MKKYQLIKKRLAALGLAAIITLTGCGGKNHESKTPDISTKPSISDFVDTPDESVDITETLTPELNETPDISITPDESIEESVVTPSLEPEKEKDKDKEPAVATPEKVTPSSKPTVTPTETPTHTHAYGAWTSYDDTKEIRTCACGEIETKDHQYVTKTTTTKDLNNYTYTTITTKKCSSCNHEVEVSNITKDMTFSLWQYNKTTKLDERKCLDFDYTETREHIHDYEFKFTYDEEYEYHECACGKVSKVKHVLDDGTKDKNGNTIYNCTNPECDYTKTKKPSSSHSHGGSSSTPSHTHSYQFSYYDDTYEYWICSTDNAVKKEPHKLKTSVNPDGSTTYTCEHPECSYTKTIAPAHTHNYSVLARTDDTYEYWVCPDDQAENKVAHVFDNGNRVGDTITYTCTNPSCGYTKEVQAEHVHIKGAYDHYDENYEYYKCETCSEYVTVPHTLGTPTVNSNQFYRIEEQCETCDYLKITPHSHEYKIDSWNEYNETLKCICGNEITQSHSYIEGNQNCQNAGCGYVKPLECEHNSVRHEEQSLDRNDTDCYYDVTICNDCGKEIHKETKGHDYYETFYQEGVMKTEKCKKCDWVKTTFLYEQQSNGPEIFDDELNNEELDSTLESTPTFEEQPNLDEIIPEINNEQEQENDFIEEELSENTINEVEEIELENETKEETTYENISNYEEQPYVLVLRKNYRNEKMY